MPCAGRALQSSAIPWKDLCMPVSSRQCARGLQALHSRPAIHPSNTLCLLSAHLTCLPLQYSGLWPCSTAAESSWQKNKINKYKTHTHTHTHNWSGKQVSTLGCWLKRCPHSQHSQETGKSCLWKTISASVCTEVLKADLCVSLLEKKDITRKWLQTNGLAN